MCERRRVAGARRHVTHVVALRRTLGQMPLLMIRRASRRMRNDGETTDWLGVAIRHL